MDALLEVSDLTKVYSDRKAVDGLSFSLQKGEVLGFLGENGAGKSTTIRMILKLIKPDAGSVNFNGVSCNDAQCEILRQTGAVIERPDLYKYLSAYANLRLFAKLSGLKPTRSFLMSRLAEAGLAGREFSKVKTFSQGMKQRLGIAIALVHEPKLVILDEPLNGLDPQGIAEMRVLIREMAMKEGRTVIISSHLLAEIKAVASRVLIIHRGRKMYEGPAEDFSEAQFFSLTQNA